MLKLVCIDQATVLPVRYEHSHSAPGELNYLDVKKLGRIPDGGGWRVHGRGFAQDPEQDRRAGWQRSKAHRRGVRAGRGYSYLHCAVDDLSGMVYSEILPDEKNDTEAGFLKRACALFSAPGHCGQAGDGRQRRLLPLQGI